MSMAGMAGFSSGRRVQVYERTDDLLHAAADVFAAHASAAIDDHGRFAVALAGGSTPRGMHTLLAGPGYRDRIDWSRIWFYWGDERTVPPDSPESNYHMAVETLLSKVPVGQDQIFRIPAELPDPAVAARDYADVLRETFELSEGEVPAFDLIFLGMGPDGHTASLFPHTEALEEIDELVAPNYVPKLNTNRITLTVPVLNASSAIAFLVAGQDKADALAAVLEGPYDPDTYPSQLVSPVAGELLWLVDAAAAAKLTGTERG